MKRLIYFLSLSLLTVGCSNEKREPTPEPDLTAGLTGNYSVSSFTAGNTTVYTKPNELTGLLKVTRKGNNLVGLLGTITANGKSDTFIEGDLKLVKKIGNEYYLRDGSTDYGTIKPNSIELSYVENDGTLLKVSAIK